MKNILVRLLATGFYSGYSPVAPGTAGTILALLLYLFLPGLRGVNLLILSIITIITGIWVSSEVEKTDGHDAQIIVIDEMAGMWVALLFLPVGFQAVWLILPFCLFRLLDIFKPWPIDNLQNLPVGWGVMADDIMAGVMANLLFRIVIGIILGLWL